MRMDIKNLELETLTGQQWESLCNRCTRCCYEKIDYDGKIIYTKVPCEQLDLHTGLCKVYTERDQVRSDCQRLTPELVAAGILPGDCPYTEYIDNYQGPSTGEEE